MQNSHIRGNVWDSRFKRWAQLSLGLVSSVVERAPGMESLVAISAHHFRQAIVFLDLKLKLVLDYEGMVKENYVCMTYF